MNIYVFGRVRKSLYYVNYYTSIASPLLLKMIKNKTAYTKKKKWKISFRKIAYFFGQNLTELKILLCKLT